MAKKMPVRQQDQFLVRLPEGMRDRIKEKAERAGMSMNEAIVFCLEQWFPAPQTLEQKIDELVEMVAILKGDDTEKGVNRLVAAVHDTIVDVYDGTLKTPPNFDKLVSERFERWQEDEAERANDDAYNPFDDANYPDRGQGPTQGDWNPSSPDYDPFTDEPLPATKKD